MRSVIERLIRIAGFDPVGVGGVGESLRIEVGGDLHASGGLNGRLVDREEAESLVSKSKSPAQHQTGSEDAARDYIAVYNTHDLDAFGRSSHRRSCCTGLCLRTASGAATAIARSTNGSSNPCPTFSSKS